MPALSAEAGLAPVAQHGAASSFAWQAEAGLLLEAGLPDGWCVERFIDPEGDLSVIVLAGDDDAEQRVFLLHERDEVVHVATIVADEWQGDQPCASWTEAAATIISLAAGTPHPHAALRAA